MDESLLIEQCKSGKREAQYQLYTMYSKAMYNICFRMMNDQMDAEDVLQTSFVQVFTRLSDYRYESTIGAWIKRIVVNNCINMLRKNKLKIESLDDKHDVPLISDEPVTYNIQKVKDAIYLLSDGYRAIFSLYAMEGYDHGEIAEIMNISESTSKSQYSRAKAKLIQILRESGEINNIYN